MTAGTALKGARTDLNQVFNETRTALRTVSGSPALRRVQLAFGGSLFGDAVYFIALTVWAYDAGGIRAVGVWLALRYVVAALVVPLGSVLARVSAQRAMIGSDLLRCLLVVAAAACLYAGTPPWPIYVLGTVSSVLSNVSLPAQMALMPRLATTPDELTASHSVSSMLEGLAFFAGPAVGAVLLALTDIPTVFLVNAATFVWSALLVAGIQPPPSSRQLERRDVLGAEKARSHGRSPGAWAEAIAGVKAIRDDRDLLMVASLVSLQTVVAGALIVFNVMIAIQVLDTNADGVGYLEAVLGLGAIAGGLFAIAHASHDRLAWDLRLGVLLWSLPLVLVAVIPEAFSAFIAMALIGFANAVVYVTYVIILQRRTPEAVQGLVFGAVGGLLVGAMALGSFATPYMIDWLGLRWALALVGVVVVGLVLPWSPRVRRLDGVMAEPDGLALLRTIGFFQALSPPALDALARQLGERTAAPGEVILRQGETSDRFFVIEAGRVKVVQDGRELREEGPGEFFGEIGLLRDEPRSATVTAVEPTVLRTLDREVFLPVVTGNERASTALEDIVTRRLAV